VALVVADDAFLARPDDAHWAIDALLVQPQRRQAEDDLQRHVLASAERAADGRVLDAHTVGRQAQGVGDLPAVFVRPLAGDLDRHAPLVVNVADAGFGLQVGVLLMGQVVAPLDDDLGRGPAGVHVPLANLVVLEDVAAVPRVKHPFVLHRLVNVGDEGQRLPLDSDEGRGAGGVGLRFGHNQGDVIPLPQADVAVGLVAAQADKDGLVGQPQAVLVDRHVGGSEHGDLTPGAGAVMSIDSMRAWG
jgi:hypothetical protein